MAAGLSYYFVLSLFPLLIAFAAALALVPLPNLFDQILALMARFVPSDSMGLVRSVLRDVITPHGGSLLSVGILATIWAASGGVAALIEAVNVAYDLPDKRSFVQRRLLAIALMFAVGALGIAALSVLVVGPGFGRWLAGKVGLGAIFVALWPYLRWVLSVSCAVLSIELIYMWAPSSRGAFHFSLPGAVMALATWLALSSVLGLYLRNFGRLNKTYGTLAAAVALMVWFYRTEKVTSRGCIEAVIPAFCTADVISATLFIATGISFPSTGRKLGPPESPKQAPPLLRAGLIDNCRNPGVRALKVENANIRGTGFRLISESILRPVPYSGKCSFVKRILCRQFIEQSKGGESGRCNPLRNEQRQDYDSEVAGIASVVRVKRVSILA